MSEKQYSELFFDQNFGNNIDISQILDLTEQKTICNNLISIIEEYEIKLKNKFISIQTITDFIDENKHLKVDMGEFIGYQFGCISNEMMMINTALSKLDKFINGELDNIDSSARSMYIAIWYDLALSNIELLTDSMYQMERIESNLIQQQIQKSGSNQNIIKKGYIH